MRWLLALSLVPGVVAVVREAAKPWKGARTGSRGDRAVPGGGCGRRRTPRTRDGVDGRFVSRGLPDGAWDPTPSAGRNRPALAARPVPAGSTGVASEVER
jgi:hypothetical protein